MITSLPQKSFRSLLAGLLFITTGLTFGQSIWTNPIDATNPALQNPYTTGDVKDPNINVSGIGRGSGITANAGNGRYNATNWTMSNSVNADEYFSFTLTPILGYKINFVSLVYTLQRSSTGPSNFAVRSSLDNYAANIVLITETGTAAVEKTIALSGAAFQNISSAITFRIYGYNATGATGTSSINDFTFNGQANSLGIDDIEPVKTGFTVYPNPATQQIVRFNIITDIDVYDTLGKRILSQKQANTLDIRDFTAGVYFIKTPEGITQRLIVK